MNYRKIHPVDAVICGRRRLIVLVPFTSLGSRKMRKNPAISGQETLKDPVPATTEKLVTTQ